MGINWLFITLYNVQCIGNIFSRNKLVWLQAGKLSADVEGMEK